MNRYYCMLLCFIACLLVGIAGCRRSGGGVPRDPVLVKDEKDLLLTESDKDLLFQMRLAERRYKIYIEDVRLVEAELKDAAVGAKKLRWQAIAERQEEMEKDNKGGGQAMASKMKEANVKAEQLAEFDEFGKHALAFLNKHNANAYSVNNFHTYARRKNLMVPEKYLDKMEWVIVAREIPIHRLIDEKKIAFVPEVDMNLPSCIVAYRDGTGDSAGNSVMFAEGKSGKLKADVIKEQLRFQELQVLHRHYLAFAASHFLILPSAKLDADAWISGFQASAAGFYDAKLKLGIATRRQLVKDPFEPREWTKFRQYVRDNAPPPIFKSIDDRKLPGAQKQPEPTIAVNMNTNLRVNDPRIFATGDPVACRIEMETYKVMIAQNQFEDRKGHRTVFHDGSLGWSTPENVAFFLPKKDGKKDGKMP